MEYFGTTLSATGLHVEGFPNAAKLIRLDGPKARRLADLVLHKHDLDFARECLEEIRRIQVPTEPPSLPARALWRIAIVYFAKCFGSSESRSALAERTVYRGEPEVAFECFHYFKDLRNKHIAHDENAYAQSLPGAVLNGPDHEYKVAKIVCFQAVADVLGQQSYANLRLLVDKALVWVVKEFDGLCDVLTRELEAQPYEALLARDGIAYSKPTVDDMGRSRRGSAK